MVVDDFDRGKQCSFGDRHLQSRGRILLSFIVYVEEEGGWRVEGGGHLQICSYVPSSSFSRLPCC